MRFTYKVFFDRIFDHLENLDYTEYTDMMDNLALFVKFSLQNPDYTDLLIPEKQQNRRWDKGAFKNFVDAKQI